MSKMLSSWKEIAQFFGKGVRTVQRWEKTLALPIHRPPGAPSNVVLARTSDLEAWMHHGPAERALAGTGDGSSSNASTGLVEIISSLEGEVRELRACLTGHPEDDRTRGESASPSSDADRIRLVADDLRTLRTVDLWSAATPEIFVQRLPWPAAILDAHQQLVQCNFSLSLLLRNDDGERSRPLSEVLGGEFSKAASISLRKHVPSTIWQKEITVDGVRGAYDFHLTPLTLGAGEAGMLLLLAPRELRAETSLAA